MASSYQYPGARKSLVRFGAVVVSEIDTGVWEGVWDTPSLSGSRCFSFAGASILKLRLDSLEACAGAQKKLK